MSLEKYNFTIEGKKYAIPHFNQIPVGVLRKSRKSKDEMDQVFTILELVLGDDSDVLDAVDTLDGDRFQAWLKGWTQGAPVGESSSSES